MAHSFDTSAQIAASTNNPVTGSYTCGAGATLLVVTLVYANGTRTGAPTYNSVSLTQADQVRKAATNPEACAELWYLLDPPTGSSYTISVPNSNGLSLEVCISSYKAGTARSSALSGATGGQNNGSANPSVSITPSLGGAVIVAVVASGADSWAPTARGGTQLYDTDNGDWGGGHQYFLQTTAAAKAMSWTFATSDDWGECVAAFIAVPKGIGVSKGVVYSALGPSVGIDVAKAVVYSVLGPVPPGINVSKAVVYTVLEPVEPEGTGADWWPFFLRYLSES